MYVQVLIIEVNTVPGMTPSTVLIHQVMTISLMQMIQYSSNETLNHRNFCWKHGMQMSTMNLVVCWAMIMYIKS